MAVFAKRRPNRKRTSYDPSSNFGSTANRASRPTPRCRSTQENAMLWVACNCEQVHRAVRRASCLAALIFAGSCLAQPDDPARSATPPKETPLSMVNALHTAFGEHHARAVHTKGVMVE